MALFLSEDTPPAEVDRAAAHPWVLGMKYYPAGATTHSTRGVRRPERVYAVLEAMQRAGLVLQVHAELPDAEVDVYAREPAFLERVLAPMLQRFPELRVVIEHVSTRIGVEFVRAGAPRLAATLTPQHLLHNRNALFHGGLRPHYYCLPLLQGEADRRALVAAATGGETCFFLGTDSAPHARGSKESACGCAGIYSARGALEFYAEVFETADRLHRLEAFAAHHGADFYGLARNHERVTLVRQPWRLPRQLPFDGEPLVPLHAGATCRWQLAPSAPDLS